MSFDAQFRTMFPNTLRVTPCTGKDYRGGEPTYVGAVAFTVPCRISGKGLALRRHDQGQDVSPIFDIWAFTEGRHITHDDKVEVVESEAAWQQGSALHLFAIGNYTDEDGVHHTKLQCGWMYHRQGQ